MTDRGLRLWHVMILAALHDVGPHSKGELASRLDINQSDVVKVVDDLLRAGQVDCARDPADRRRIEVTLTPEGRAALADISAELSALDDDLLSPLTTTERAQLATLLRRLQLHICRPGREDGPPPRSTVRHRDRPKLFRTRPTA
ncbi:MarR family winged helix-turn-helix transcriptional regulator [Streptomyces sp. KR80]|uniref:MarR family winged helix-turn-helix transcriptional regulator n=1 Tax=Streptomyces sp. KR80 TaxID=3457426 RepID=UPI003FD2D919